MHIRCSLRREVLPDCVRHARLVEGEDDGWGIEARDDGAGIPRCTDEHVAVGKGYLVDAIRAVPRYEHARVSDVRAVLSRRISSSTLRKVLSEGQSDAVFNGIGFVRRENLRERGRSFVELGDELFPELQELV